jgi:anti-sigma B factor antagonist
MQRWALPFDIDHALERSIRHHERRHGVVATGDRAMSCSIQIEGELVVVRPEGQLNAASRIEFKQKVVDELERGGQRFLIDLSAVEYIDSAGLGALVGLSKRIRDQGAELRLANLNADITRVFELTKLNTLFEIVEPRVPTLASR